MPKRPVDLSRPTGDDLLAVFASLANPHRLRIVAELAGKAEYVSRLARVLDISRPLLQVHLRRLEAAGLVTATVTVSPEGKAMKYYQLTDFALQITPESLAAAARTLSAPPPGDAPPIDDDRGTAADRAKEGS